MMTYDDYWVDKESTRCPKPVEVPGQICESLATTKLSMAASQPFFGAQGRSGNAKFFDYGAI